MKNKKIAVTGGIGNGKSTVLTLLKEKGYPVYSCDEIYKEIIKTKSYIEQISNIFPSVIVDNQIDKGKLASIVFTSGSARKKLNEISHPLIMKSLLKKMNTETQGVVFAEVPLLFEGNYENLFDGVILVKRKLEDRIQATIQRDHQTREEVLAKIQTQFDVEKQENKNRIKKCNAYIIDNDCSIQLLNEKVDKIIKTL